MQITRQDERAIGRLLRMAEQEKTALFKSMPKDFKDRLKGVSLRFEDTPGKDLIKRGVKPEALTLTDRDSKEITIFLMNLRDRFGRFPKDVRQQLRKAILQELAASAGIDVALDDGP